ncbi:thioesterase family protein [Tabrizicola sp.]|jgi:4-hydroxybenzoyl-CoA thioesterase|uniref:acyl-CoA thioesterase n=1 Tax=Tabrizicola sp. TaxID=2005166 RepID=UPI0025DA7E03|nr:thioesterase family protein [Tabrizicola sp.]MBY0350350.1 acyl-CoA thioesterase [Tabrizicola sp.]
MTHAFTADRPLRFGDCDFSGTAYFPAYLNLLNGVVEEFWTHLGWPWHRTIRTEDWGTPTVHLTCDFAKASRMGDVLTFRLAVLKVGRSSLRLAHEIRCGDDLRWTAEQVLAACRISTYAAIPWPPEVRARLETLI